MKFIAVNTVGLDVYQLKPPVDQVDVGQVAGVPASGRLTKIDNGYGAITRIGYKSAKEDTQSAHNLPYPEIVVTAVATTGAFDLRLESTTHYAYRDAGLIFDPGYDAFIFPGYQRTVELPPPAGNAGWQRGDLHRHVRPCSLRSGHEYHRAQRHSRRTRQRRDHRAVAWASDPWALDIETSVPTFFAASPVRTTTGTRACSHQPTPSPDEQ
jgi:hypothetical protein